MNFNLLLWNISYFFLGLGRCDWKRATNGSSITSFLSNTKRGEKLFKFCFETNWERILIPLDCSILAFIRNRMSVFSTQNYLGLFSFFFFQRPATATSVLHQTWLFHIPGWPALFQRPDLLDWKIINTYTYLILIC